MGCEARKIPVDGDVFFLDFAFYRTNPDLSILRLVPLTTDSAADPDKIPFGPMCRARIRIISQFPWRPQ
jgi:hypothetical protein